MTKKAKAQAGFIQKVVAVAPAMALVISVSAALLTGAGTVITFLNVRKTHEYALIAQTRNAHFDTISRFYISANQIGDVSAAFVAAINGGGDLGQVRLRMSEFTAKQLLEVENINRVFGSDLIGLSAYRTAIAELGATSQRVTSPTEMRVWAEAFGRAIDSKNELVKALYGRVGIAG